MPERPSMDGTKIIVHPGFYVIRGENVEIVVSAASTSDLIDFDSIRSIEIVKEYENMITMVCLRKKA